MVRINGSSCRAAVKCRPSLSAASPTTVPRHVVAVQRAVSSVNTDMYAHTVSDDAHSAPVLVRTLDNFQDTLTLLGDITDSCFRGYVGQWRLWAPPVNNNSSDLQMLQDEVNFRIFKLSCPDPPTVHQVNLQQHPVPNSTTAAFKPFLTSDVAPGRPDGYRVRQWNFKPEGTLWETDASSWRSGPGATSAPEVTRAGLAVRDNSLGLVNGGLPTSASHTADGVSTVPWYMEVIIRDPSSHARRWGIILRYDAGQLKETRTIPEDLVEMTKQQIDTQFINPAAIKFLPRRDRLPADIDTWLSQVTSAGTPVSGTAVTFSYDEQHQLTRASQPCSWSSAHVTDSHVSQTFPDGMYIRVPRNIGPGATAGKLVTVELGAVMSGGSLARWLVDYDTSSSERLLKQATYEVYPAVTGSVQPTN